MLLDTLRKSQLEARKAKDSAKVSFLSLIIGDSVAVGKNNGNRESTESEVVAVIKKHIKTTTETLQIVSGEAADKLKAEMAILESFLPKQLTEDELKKVIAELTGDVNNIGNIMKGLKAKYEGQYDGGLANRLAKEHLNAIFGPLIKK